MERFARHALITASFALLALTACSSTPPRETGPAVAKRDLDSYLVGQVGPQRIPGLVAMVVDAKQTLYVGAFGQQDVAGNKPMRPDTIFRIASMTKPVTAVAAVDARRGRQAQVGRSGVEVPAGVRQPPGDGELQSRGQELHDATGDAR